MESVPSLWPDVDNTSFPWQWLRDLDWKFFSHNERLNDLSQQIDLLQRALIVTLMVVAALAVWHYFTNRAKDTQIANLWAAVTDLQETTQSLTTRLNQHHDSLGDHKGRLVDLEERAGGLEERVSELAEDFDPLENRVRNHGDELGAVRRELSCMRQVLRSVRRDSESHQQLCSLELHGPKVIVFNVIIVHFPIGEIQAATETAGDTGLDSGTETTGGSPNTGESKTLP